jgi:glutamyl-tRNA reductase
MFYCRSVNHHYVDLAVRERLSLTTQQQQQWLGKLQDTEAVILSTCNRFELYAHLDTPEHMDLLWNDLLSVHIEPPQSFSGIDAARHLFRVTSGLESMALGEPQILGQVTRAYEQALDQGTARHVLSLLFRAAIHAAKRVHSETHINTGIASVSSLGIARAETEIGSLLPYQIIVLGAGEMGQMVIKTLVQRNIKNITVISRTYDHARRVADQWEIQARPITDLKEALLQAQVLFTTSNAPFTILSCEDIVPIMRTRGGNPLCIIDLAVPRDVEPDVAHIDGVHLYDLDDLQQTIEASLAERQKLIPQVEHIIEQDLSVFWMDYQGRAVAPMIRQIREQAESIRQAELSHFDHKLADDETRQLMDQFSHRLMNKLLHNLTRNLKAKAGEEDAALLRAMARDLFGLEDSA